MRETAAHNALSEEPNPATYQPHYLQTQLPPRIRTSTYNQVLSEFNNKLRDEQYSPSPVDTSLLRYDEMQRLQKSQIHVKLNAMSLRFNEDYRVTKTNKVQQMDLSPEAERLQRRRMYMSAPVYLIARSEGQPNQKAKKPVKRQYFKI